VLRVVSGKMGWTVDVFSPEKPLCAYSKFINSTYISPSPLNRKDYYSELCKLIVNNRYDAFLSFDDDITSILSENEDELRRFFDLDRMLPPRESVLVADSKNLAMEFAKKIDIPTPEFFIPKNESELKGIQNKMSYPVVVKGEKGSGSWKIRYANNFEELKKYYKELVELEKNYSGRPSVQEHIEGEGHLLHILCNQGETLRVCDHVKRIQYPPRGGVTAVGETVYNRSIVDYAVRMCRALNWTGLSKFDFIKDKKDGKFKFIEIDPRVSASIIIPQVAATEMVENFCRIIEGKRVEAILSFETGVRYRLILPRELQHLIKNPRHIFSFIRNFFVPNTFHDICLTDIKPTLKSLWTTLYVIKEELIFKRGKYVIVESQKIDKRA